MRNDRDMLDAFMYLTMYSFDYDRRLREMLEDNKMKCACKKEYKEFCVVYTMEGEERHVVIVAKDEIDAAYQFYNMAKVLNSITGLDNCFLVKRVYQEC